MQPNHQRIPSDGDDITVPSLALCASTIYSPTSEIWRVKSPCLPQRHSWRFEMMKKKNEEKFRTIYFSPAAPIRDSGVAFGDALARGLEDPDTAGVEELRNRHPGSVVGTDQCNGNATSSGPPPSQSELDYLVNVLARPIHDLCPPDSAVFLSSSLSSPTICLPGASLPNRTGVFLSCVQTALALQQPHKPVLPLPSLFKNLALTDPNVSGQPIRYISTSFQLGSNNLKVGCCTFLNLPYGANVECGLRIESNQLESNVDRKDKDSRQSVLLQIVQSVVNARTGKPAWLLCAETNVSGGFTPEVRAELAAKSGRCYSSERPKSGRRKERTDPMTMELLSSTIYAPLSNANPVPRLSSPANRETSSWAGFHHVRFHDSVMEESRAENGPSKDVWLDIAVSLSNHPGHHEGISLTLPPQLSLNRSSVPSPRTDDLISLFDEIKFLHRRFFIIRMASPSRKKTISQQPNTKTSRQRFSIPYLSAPLYAYLHSVSTQLNTSKLHHLSRQIQTTTSSATEQSRRAGEEPSAVQIFKDAMASQLSRFISDLSPSSSARQSCEPLEAFWQHVRLPEFMHSVDDGPDSLEKEIRAAESGAGAECAVHLAPMHDSALLSRSGGGQRKREDEDGCKRRGDGQQNADVKCYVCFLVPSGVAGMLRE